MKVPQSVLSRWQFLNDEYAQLKPIVDRLLLGAKRPRWHYESRLKERESYALKMETGRFPAGDVQDFLACTLVVENRNSVGEAEALVRQLLALANRKPETDDFTYKESNEFSFDDLRLYCHLKVPEDLPPTGFEHLQFEVQVKTFLQHAWSIATHDLVYKAEAVNWSLERVAFEVKAMLEHAENSISAASTLATAHGREVRNRRTEAITEMVAFYAKHWDGDRLPKDRVRLANTTVDLVAVLGLETEEVEAALVAATAEGRGAAMLSLSPYGAVVDAIQRRYPKAVEQYLSDKRRRTRFRIFVPDELADEGVFANAEKSRITRLHHGK